MYIDWYSALVGKHHLWSYESVVFQINFLKHELRLLLQGSAAVRRHSDKITKYLHDCNRKGIQFLELGSIEEEVETEW